jgi:predicted nucleotidyltransferase component of viral defense system
LREIPNRSYFDRISGKTAFSAWPLEKLYRLIDILSEVNRGELKQYLAVRGGTAINLCYSQLPRLSIDLDLVLTRNGDSNNMAKDRKIVRQRITEILKSGGYLVDAYLNEYALDRFEAKYNNIFGSADRLKVEVNYVSSRVPIFPTVDVEPIDVFRTGPEQIRTLSRQEIYGSKIEPLIKRHAPRDLFDTYTLARSSDQIDTSTLRKCTVFSCCVEIPWDFRADLLRNPADVITQKQMATDLRPYLVRDNSFNLSEAKGAVGDFCHELFKLDPNELSFLEKLFENKQYVIDLLFPSANHLRDYPGMKWRLRHITDGSLPVSRPWRAGFT